MRRKSGGFRAAHRGRRGSASGNLGAMQLLGAAGYGALREKISNALLPVTSKVPLGNIADEVVIGGLAYYGHKKVSNPLLKGALKAAVYVEAARIGETIANGQLGLGGSTSSGSVF